MPGSPSGLTDRSEGKRCRSYATPTVNGVVPCEAPCDLSARREEGYFTVMVIAFDTTAGTCGMWF